MIGPVSAPSYVCEEVPRHRKKAIKKVPKKSNHKHTFEPVILSYINPNGEFSPERGFISQRDYCAGRRCSICGKLDYGFPDGKPVRVASRIEIPWFGEKVKKHIVINPEYKHLPVVEIKDYWKLEEVKSNE